jgi:hypothetical protein
MDFREVKWKVVNCIVTSSSGRHNEPWGSVKCMEFLDQLSDFWPHGKGPVPWSYIEELKGKVSLIISVEFHDKTYTCFRKFMICLNFCCKFCFILHKTIPTLSLINTNKKSYHFTSLFNMFIRTPTLKLQMEQYKWSIIKEVFWDVTPYSLECFHWPHEGICCLNLGVQESYDLLPWRWKQQVPLER